MYSGGCFRDTEQSKFLQVWKQPLCSEGTKLQGWGGVFLGSLSFWVSSAASRVPLGLWTLRPASAWSCRSGEVDLRVVIFFVALESCYTFLSPNFICSFVYSSICSFNHSFIHSTLIQQWLDAKQFSALCLWQCMWLPQQP